MYLQLMLGQGLELEQELGWLAVESESGPQQGPPGSDWTCSKETETLCGWEWGWGWGWAWSWSPSLFRAHVRC